MIGSFGAWRQSRVPFEEGECCSMLLVLICDAVIASKGVLALVLFSGVGEFTAFHICHIAAHSVMYLFARIHVSAQKTRAEVLGIPKHVINHQYLSVNLRAGANTDSRDFD